MNQREHSGFMMDHDLIKNKTELGTMNGSTLSTHSASDINLNQQTTDDPALQFDRRWEPRARTTGWAQVVCTNPYHMFLGGTKSLADFSNHGIGLLSDCEIPEGEIVEIRLMPFRVRGKMGTVTRCEKFSEIDNDNNTKTKYRVGVSFHRICSAA